MIDESAIKALQEGASIHQASEALCASSTTLDMVALPNDFQLHDLEKHLEFRRRARGVMETKSLASYCAYTNQHAEAGATVFISTDKMKATAVLNLGEPEEPGHCDNRAIYAPDRAAPYEALLAFATGALRKQAEVAEFFEDWPEHCKFFSGTEMLEPNKAIGAIRKLTIEGIRRLESSEQQLSASKGVFESVQATAETPIPTIIYFECVPYSVLPPRLFVMRLSIITGGDKPLLTLRIQTLDKHREEMGHELAAVITAEFAKTESKPPVLLGQYEKA